MPAPKGYSVTQIGLHWIVAVLIVLQLVFGEAIGDAWEEMEEGGAAVYDAGALFHIGVGVAVLVLTLWRLSLRASRGAPPAPMDEPPLFRMLAHLGHLALYALMIVAPLTGLVAWFGGLEAAAEVHEVMKPLFIVLILAHVGAVIWHQVWLKDNLLERMKRPLD